MGVLPIDLSGAITAGVATIGNLLGASKSYKQQKALAELQFKHNMALQDDQQLYNSMPNQMNLARQAGVNPYAALGNSSSSGIASVSQGSAPNLSNIGNDAVSSYRTGSLVGAEQAQLNSSALNAIEQAKMFQKSQAEIAARTKNQKIQNEILDYQSKDWKEHVANMNKLILSQRAEAEANSALTSLQATGQHLHNKRYDEIVDRQLAVDAARIQLMYSEGILNKASAGYMTEQALLAAANRAGVVLDNGIRREARQAIVNSYTYKNNLDIKQGRLLDKDNQFYFWNHTFGNGSGFSGNYQSTPKGKYKGFKIGK